MEILSSSAQIFDKANKGMMLLLEENKPKKQRMNKLETARQIVQENLSLNRKELIALIMSKCDLSKESASVYACKLYNNK